jgi:hypothetical protein
MSPAQHLRSLWGHWWPLAFSPLAFLAVIAGLGDAKPEHWIIVALLTVLAVAGERPKAFLIAVLPGLAIAFGYELVRYLRPVFVTPDRILGCELRSLEQALFSFGNASTLSDYFATHHAPVFDVFFAVPYTAFWMVAVAYSLFLYFRNREQLSRYLWLLAAVHGVSFVIWMAVPAAPPWYVLSEGCTIDPDAAPSAAALLRVDRLFGITYFESFYSRAPTVFGALPSLHCAFPVAGLLAAWRNAGWGERMVHLAYSAWMLCASVYLLHHWLLDGLLGIAIVVAAHLVLTRLSLGRRRTSRG